MSMGNMGNEHPGINFNSIKEQLSLEEIQLKLKELVDRLNFAYATSNQPMINQLSMLQATYNRAQQEMSEEMFNSSSDNITGKIDIS